MSDHARAEGFTEPSPRKANVRWSRSTRIEIMSLGAVMVATIMLVSVRE